MVARSSETLELSMPAEYKTAREVSKAVTEASNQSERVELCKRIAFQGRNRGFASHKGCFLSPLMFPSFALTLNKLGCTDFAEVRLHSQTQRKKNILYFSL